MFIEHWIIEDEDVNVSEIVPLFKEVDQFATNNTYNESTADLSREWLFDGASDEEISDSKALNKYLVEFCDELVVAIDEETGEYIGFTAISINDEWFAEEHPEYVPNIGVWISGVHPEYQQQGVWSTLREYVETKISPNRDAKYLITEVDPENTASKKANESRDMNEVKEEDASSVYVKEI